MTLRVNRAPECNTLIFSSAILKSDLEQIFMSRGFMANKVPFWVYEQRQATSDMVHRDRERKLEDRIAQLEKENSDLKKKIAKMENAFLIAMDLLMK